MTQTDRQESAEHKYIRAEYRLYDVTESERELIEETTPSEPFTLISGMGIVLDEFERQIAALAQGETFAVTLTPDQAYGEYVEARVVDLDKQMFCPDGKFDSRNVYPEAVIQLQNADGNHFMGRVVEIGSDKVRVDLNHPLAGRTLCFEGKILESREATVEEMERVAKMLAGECGCGDCGHCEGNCHGGDCHCE